MTKDLQRESLEEEKKAKYQKRAETREDYTTRSMQPGEEKNYFNK